MGVHSYPLPMRWCEDNGELRAWVLKELHYRAKLNRRLGMGVLTSADLAVNAFVADNGKSLDEIDNGLQVYQRLARNFAR